MKKIVSGIVGICLVMAMSVNVFADNFVNFSDSQPVQLDTSGTNAIYTNATKGFSGNGVVDTGIKNGEFAYYNNYIYYLDKSNAGYIDLRRMKTDKTEDTFIYRIVTGENYALESYILGDSNLYYTICNIKTQRYSFKKIDLVTKTEKDIYTSDTAMLDVLASQNGYAYVCETTFDKDYKMHRVIYKVNVNKGTDKVVLVTTKTEVTYTCARITGNTLYINKVDVSSTDGEYTSSLLVIDLKTSRIIKEIKLGTRNTMDIKNGVVIEQDQEGIYSYDLTTGVEKQLLKINGDKTAVGYLGFINGKLYYVSYEYSTFKNSVYAKNVISKDETLIASWIEERVE